MNYDQTTPRELVALAVHLASDPKLADIFNRAGLHKSFERHFEYPLVVDSRNKFAPDLINRPCGPYNTVVSVALARRLYFKLINNDSGSLEFVTDRIRRDADEFGERSTLFESEIRDMLSNLIKSEFFTVFEGYKHNKNFVLDNSIYVYDGLTEFIAEQMFIYALADRSWAQVRMVILSFLRNYWFDDVPDLTPPTVTMMLNAPQSYTLFPPDFTPRKGL